MIMNFIIQWLSAGSDQHKDPARKKQTAGQIVSIRQHGNQSMTRETSHSRQQIPYNQGRKK